MKKNPEIILVIEASREAGRGLLAGILRYSNTHGPWTLHRHPPYYVNTPHDEVVISWIKEHNADGIIMRNWRDDDSIVELGIPTISLSVYKDNPSVPNIVTDDHKAGEMAADYFLGRGFGHLAFCGFAGMPWSQCRGESFCSRARKGGIEPYVYNPPNIKSKLLWNEEFPVLVDWLNSLPKPIAIMACNDDRGQNVLEAGKAARLYVPGEISVLGADNDPLVCELTNPKLSSVAFDFENAGFKAAQMMDRMLSGEDCSKEKIVASPTKIITRASTDIMMIDDADVVRAIEFIQKNLHKPTQVVDVAAHLSLTRQGLNKKFKKHLGRSVHDEIIRVKIQHITYLLSDTDMTISEMAYSTGFSELKGLSRVFRRVTGMSPKEYRKKYIDAPYTQA